jgi:hypothetical protein
MSSLEKCHHFSSRLRKCGFHFFVDDDEPLGDTSGSIVEDLAGEVLEGDTPFASLQRLRVSMVKCKKVSLGTQ